MVNSSGSLGRTPISIDCRLSHSLMLFVERTSSLRLGLKMVWRLSEFFEPSSCPSKKENRSRLPTSRELSDENRDLRQDLSATNDRRVVSSNRRLWNLFCAIQPLFRRPRHFSGKRCL